MRVTFLLADAGNLAGGNRVLAQHAAWLRDAGHDITLINRPRGPGAQTLKARLRRLFKPEQGGRGVGGGHFETMGLDVVSLLPGASVYPHDLPDADVLVASWWETVEWAVAMTPEKGALVHLIQDYEMFPHLPQDRVAAVYAQPCTKIVIADWLRRTLEREHGVTAEICANGVDCTTFDAPATAPGAPGSPLTVGFLHSVAPRKTVMLAIDALTLARARLPDLRVKSFGAHRLKKPLPDWIDYRHRPPQDMIPQIYASCDLWLFPSRSEGFGLPILEAMACHTPVLATDAGAAPDLIDGTNGRVLPYDSEAFAEAIVDFAATPEARRRAMGDAARRTAEANDQPRASARFAALLEQAAGARG
jgi:glycosyltransferase involved in cell wall biosynthesis